MICTCLQKSCLKMHIYCLKTTNVKLVQIFLQYLNLPKQLPMLSINKHGIRKIKRNVLNMISNVLKNLNIKNLIERMYTNTIGQKKMRSFHQIHLQQIYVSKLCLIFVLILLQRYLTCGSRPLLCMAGYSSSKDLAHGLHLYLTNSLISKLSILVQDIYIYILITKLLYLYLEKL